MSDEQRRETGAPDARFPARWGGKRDAPPGISANFGSRTLARLQVFRADTERTKRRIRHHIPTRMMGGPSRKAPSDRALTPNDTAADASASGGTALTANLQEDERGDQHGIALPPCRSKSIPVQTCVHRASGMPPSRRRTQDIASDPAR